MRKNLFQALGAFRSGETKKFGSLSSKHNSIFSYNTCILTKSDSGEIILNVSRYSPTTSRQQHSLKVEYPNAILVDGLGFGATEDKLREAAESIKNNFPKRFYTIITKTAELDGKLITFTDSTEFFVQVGRYSKGKYKTRYAIVGNLAQAVAYFNCINIGNGYKKRLIAPSLKKSLLARVISC